MEQPRSGPPPIPLRVDLGETEESVLNSQEHPAASNLPSTDTNVPEITKAQPTPQDDKPVVIQKPSPSTLPNASKLIPPPDKVTKPVAVGKRDAKDRPTISIISARPMDKERSSPSFHFKNDKGDSTAQESNVHTNNNQQSTTTGTSLNPEHPSVPNKPGRPAPLAPAKPPPAPEDKNPKSFEASRSKAPVPNRRSKTKTPKRDSGSVFYIDTSADVDKKSSSKPKVDNASVAVPKPKPNTKSKPSLPAPRKPKTKNEPKASEVDPGVNSKVNPPDKGVSKPKLKPTIITAKTPKQVVENKTQEEIIPTPQNASNATKEMEDELPSRPSFPPSADAEELNKNESQPERPKAPPNTIKDEQKDVEKKKETKKSLFKREPTNKKQPKSKPVRPPMAKESARLKPSRPPPAKPNVSRKSSLKGNAPASKEKAKSVKSVHVKPTGPPRAQAKFDYAGATDDDLSFKAGDTIMLISKVDDDWLVGYLENDVMHQGLFPMSFVEIIVALKEQPTAEENNPTVPSEPYAVACHDFQGQSQGELSFVSGQIVMLLERINAEWLKGKLNNSVGIFPANFVKIERDLPLIKNKNDVLTPTPAGKKGNAGNEEWCRAIHDYQGEHKDDLSFVIGTKIRIIERVGDGWFKGEYSGNSGIFPASFVEVLPATNEGSQDVQLVTAIHDYPGESADDLSFKAGDKIKVIERVNSDWFMGEFGGKQGLFPASFVEGERSPVHQDPDKGEEQTKDKRIGKAIHEFTAENPGELHFGVGDAIEVLRQIDDNWSEGKFNGATGIFPTAFIEFRPSKSEEKTYAKALYDFAGDSEHDLSFKVTFLCFGDTHKYFPQQPRYIVHGVYTTCNKYIPQEGDTIQNLEHVNDEWCTGSIAGRTGHFPSSFVEIFTAK